MLAIHLGLGNSPIEMPLSSNQFVSSSNSFPELPRNQNQLLPIDFVPTDRDVICGRARENFHHDGNRYFRDLIQRSIGPYLGARTKIEKSDAIAKIVDKVYKISPIGGFVKKDSMSGRWYRIKESEARDKVGHAIRKAVQRLEETNPKAAERLRKEYSSLREPSAEGSTEVSSSETSRLAEQSNTKNPSRLDFLPRTTDKNKNKNETVHYDKDRNQMTTESDEQNFAQQTTNQHTEGKASPRFLHELDETARIPSSLLGANRSHQQSAIKNHQQHQIPLLNDLSLSKDLVLQDQIRRLQLLSSPNSSATWGQQQAQSLLLNPQQNNPKSTDHMSRLWAQKLLTQQQPSSASFPFYDQITGSRALVGGAGWTHEMAKLSAAKAQEEAIRMALHEQEYKRLKEIEYARRLSLSVPASRAVAQSASTFCSPPISAPSWLAGNPAAFASLQTSTGHRHVGTGVIDTGLRRETDALRVSEGGVEGGFESAQAKKKPARKTPPPTAKRLPPQRKMHVFACVGPGASKPMQSSQKIHMLSAK